MLIYFAARILDFALLHAYNIASKSTSPVMFNIIYRVNGSRNPLKTA